MSDRSRLIASLRAAAHSSEDLAAEMRARADQWETEDRGHECGHQFTITVTSRGHYGIVGEGPESHRDAPQMPDEPMQVTVRAHNLHDALCKASTLPLYAWIDEEDTNA